MPKFSANLGFLWASLPLLERIEHAAKAVRGTAVSLFASFLFLGQSAGVAVGAMFADHLGLATPIWAAALSMPLVGWWFAARLSSRQPAA